MASPSSSAQQALQALGTQLRQIRAEAGLSGRALGLAAGWHSSKISKIEHGRQTPTAADIRAWCLQCDAAGQVSDLIAALHAVEGGGAQRNPDVVVDLDTGEVYVKLPDGSPSSDSIGNVLDHLRER